MERDRRNKFGSSTRNCAAVLASKKDGATFSSGSGSSHTSSTLVKRNGEDEAKKRKAAAVRNSSRAESIGPAKAPINQPSHVRTCRSSEPRPTYMGGVIARGNYASGLRKAFYAPGLPVGIPTRLPRTFCGPTRAPIPPSTIGHHRALRPRARGLNYPGMLCASWKSASLRQFPSRS
jgi:hypothetical protein